MRKEKTDESNIDDLSDEELRQLVYRKTLQVENLENESYLKNLPALILDMPIHRLAVLCASLYAILYITCG